jgi:hypothetical protein
MEIRQIVEKWLTETGIQQRNLDISPEVAKRIAGIVMRSLEEVTEKRTFLTQKMESVREL